MKTAILTGNEIVKIAIVIWTEKTALTIGIVMVRYVGSTCGLLVLSNNYGYAVCGSWDLASHLMLLGGATQYFFSAWKWNFVGFVLVFWLERSRYFNDELT